MHASRTKFCLLLGPPALPAGPVLSYPTPHFWGSTLRIFWGPQRFVTSISEFKSHPWQVSGNHMGYLGILVSCMQDQHLTPLGYCSSPIDKCFLHFSHHHSSFLFDCLFCFPNAEALKIYPAVNCESGFGSLTRDSKRVYSCLTLPDFPTFNDLNTECPELLSEAY